MNDQPEITVYGTTWCPDCGRAKRILDEHRTPFRWVDIDRDSEGENFVIQTNRGYRSVPTIVFQDGSVLVEPSNTELSKKLFTLT
jgi:glutaredoxin-like protein